MLNARYRPLYGFLAESTEGEAQSKLVLLDGEGRIEQSHRRRSAMPTTKNTHRTTWRLAHRLGRPALDGAPLAEAPRDAGIATATNSTGYACP